MKKAFLGCILVLLGGLLGGCVDSEAPISVETYTQRNPLVNIKQKYLKITSLVDSVRITKITANRGKCEIRDVMDPKRKEMSLGFGEVWSNLLILKCNKLLEAEIETDKGTWTFKFDPDLDFDF